MVLEAFDDIDRDWLLNTDSLDFEGKYVLVDFWTYSCINCVRTLPLMEEFHKRLMGKGLQVVGVHTPEFDFEKNPSNVQKAIEKHGITYPVVLDQEYYLWAYFNNQYWPAHYLFDPEGELIFESIGEDGVRELAKALSGIFPGRLAGETPGFSHKLGTTPELYLGKNRGELGNSATCHGDSCNYYIPPKTMDMGKAYLEGKWDRKAQFVVPLEDGCRIHLSFKAAEISGVFDSQSRVSIAFCTGEENSSFEVDGPDTYSVYKDQEGPKKMVLDIPKGVRVYTLTFG